MTTAMNLIPLLLATLACQPPHAPEVVADDAVRILFIGNSLTYTNELPAMLADMAKTNGPRPIEYGTITLPNYSLEDHWNDGNAQQVIAAQPWDFVVLQQGPSALEESRRLLLDYTRRFDGLIRAAGARTAIYMVWPSESRFGDFERVVESYKLAAEEVNGVLFPAGQAWREAWKNDPDLEFYSDGLHPTTMGTYLAAMVMYQKLFDRSPVGLPIPKNVQIPARSITLVQQAAAAANLLYSEPTD